MTRPEPDSARWWPMCPSQSSRSAAASLRFAPPGDSAVPLVRLLITAAREPCRR